MLIRDMPAKDIKIGMRLFHRRSNKFGTIERINYWNNQYLLIAVTWDDGIIGDLYYYQKYESEVVDSDYFVISEKR